MDTKSLHYLKHIWIPLEGEGWCTTSSMIQLEGFQWFYSFWSSNHVCLPACDAYFAHNKHNQTSPDFQHDGHTGFRILLSWQKHCARCQPRFKPGLILHSQAILAHITSTFHTMFNLPTSNNLFYDGALIVQMHDDPEDLRCLIQLMYDPLYIISVIPNITA